MRGLFAALGFLTTIPLSPTICRLPAGSGLAWFPFVGLILGSVLVLGNHFLIWSRFDPFVSSILLTGLLAWLSGGLHLDGLADTADGFAGCRATSQRLEIMKDSRIGAMGSIALFLHLLLKIACLARTPNRDLLLLLGPVLGRLHLVVTLHFLPCARPEGLGRSFHPHATWRSLLAATLTSVIALLLFLNTLTAMCLGVGVVLITAWFYALCRKKIGGMTGDTLGAGCELTEASAWLLLAHCI